MAVFHGPIFGDPAGIVQDHLDQMRLVVADLGEVRTRAHLSVVQRVQTGFNVSHVQIPWIEGIGSRNRTTRFKGYHTFRMTGQTLRRQLPQIIAPHVRSMVSELG
jgi:hypothetical protein